MLIIGIDPGISGSICFFNEGKIIDVVEMPTMIEGKKNKKQVNGAQIFNEISAKIKELEKKDIKIVIEQVSAMPGQGVTSMFNFGQSYGILKGICSAMQLPMYFVRPAKWKKYFAHHRHLLMFLKILLHFLSLSFSTSTLFNAIHSISVEIKFATTVSNFFLTL